MTALAGDPPKKKTKDLSPFITDTLFRAAGGPFPIERRPASEAPQPSELTRRNYPAGSVVGAVTRTEPDTLVTLFGDRPDQDYIAAHETGHIVDKRGVIPNSAFAGLMLAMEQNPRTDWLGDEKEYIAEAFARAIQSGRGGFSDSTQVDRGMPGTIHLIRWLQTQPPFKK